MPPTRTNTKPFTPVKTERSHQENQERAYVAASRRSDRSLEARIESARRASEIHKQRTGRSLRITEAAVLNEEMYEEDDDDLPAHMRRLTAHLRLNQQDADLDRRLGSLLVSQIGMRQALPITQHSSFYRYAPNGLPNGFTHSQGMHPSLARPSPLNTDWNQNNANAHSRQNSMSHGGISPTQVTKSRISPYPTPQSPFTQAQSPASLQPHSPYQHSSSLSSAPSLSHRQDSVTSTQFPQTQTQGELETPFDLFQDTSPFVYGSPLHQDPAQTLFPFTSALPLESQQILAGSGFDYNDPSFGSMFQASDDYLQHIAPTTDEKEQQDAANEEQFGAFWNDVILGA